jgi:hypothetical protein
MRTIIALTAGVPVAALAGIRHARVRLGSVAEPDKRGGKL